MDCSIKFEFISNIELSDKDLNVLDENSIYPDITANPIFLKNDNIDSYFNTIQRITNSLLYTDKEMTYYQILLHLKENNLINFKDNNIRKYFIKEIFLTPYVTNAGVIEEPHLIILDYLISVCHVCEQIKHIKVKVTSNSKVLISTIFIQYDVKNNKVIAKADKLELDNYIDYLSNNINNFIQNFPTCNKKIIDKVIKKDKLLLEGIIQIRDNSCTGMVTQFINFGEFNQSYQNL